MPELPAPIGIPQAILGQVYAHAREAFPAEACGWLEGPKNGVEVTQAHPCVNIQSQGGHPTEAQRGEERAYVFSAPDALAFNIGFDTDVPPLIVYHSHPNGRAYFSETDTKVATNQWDGGKMYDVQQLVVGVKKTRAVAAKLFDWSEAENTFVEIKQFPGRVQSPMGYVSLFFEKLSQVLFRR